MASSSTTAWAKGFSENPAGKRLRARSIIEMLDRIGNEKVRAPGVPADEPGALLITRRELLARVLWTRDQAHHRIPRLQTGRDGGR